VVLKIVTALTGWSAAERSIGECMMMVELRSCSLCLRFFYIALSQPCVGGATVEVIAKTLRQRHDQSGMDGRCREVSVCRSCAKAVQTF
jgi:hypothetical protein